MIVEVLGTAGLLTAGAVVTVGVNNLREVRNRRRRRAQLRSLAFEHGMKLLGEEEHDLLESDMGADDASSAELDLVGVMDGRDAGGRFALGYRTLDDQGQHFLHFEHAPVGLPVGLHLEPEPRRDRRPWWQQRLRPRRGRLRGARLQLRWTAEPQCLHDDLRTRTALNWIREVARGASASSALPLSLAVDRTGVTIHTHEPLDDARLASFYERAMRLRRIMTSGQGSSPARRTVQTQVVSERRREKQRAEREDTRPVPRVEPAEEKPIESKKVVELTVNELLREMPRAKKKEFEVPEPTEEVRVIRAR